jgi:hypothetical protein
MGDVSQAGSASVQPNTQAHPGDAPAQTAPSAGSVVGSGSIHAEPAKLSDQLPSETQLKADRGTLEQKLENYERALTKLASATTREDVSKAKGDVEFAQSIAQVYADKYLQDQGAVFRNAIYSGDISQLKDAEMALHDAGIMQSEAHGKKEALKVHQLETDLKVASKEFDDAKANLQKGAGAALNVISKAEALRANAIDRGDVFEQDKAERAKDYAKDFFTQRSISHK